MLSYQQLADRCVAFGRVRRRLGNATLGYRLAALALLAGLAGLILLAGWLRNPFVNLAIFGAVAAFALWQGVRFLVDREGRREPLHEAFAMEELVPGLRSRLVSSLAFLQEQVGGPLVEAVVKRAEADAQLDFEGRLDRGDHHRRRARCLIALAAFVAVGLTPWLGFRRAGETLRWSWFAAREALFPVEYAVEPGPGRHVYQLGEEAAVSLQLKGHSGAYSEVQLLLVNEADDGAAPEQRALPLAPDGRAATGVSSDVEAEYAASFRFGERTTEPMTLVFTTAPELVNMQTELIYPTYTRLLPRTLEGVQSRLVGLPGTRMTLGFTFSKELAEARLVWDDGSEPLHLDVLGRYAAVSLIHQRARAAKLEVADTDALAMPYEVLIVFAVQADEPPSVRLPSHLKPEMSMLAEGAANFGFGVRAADDFGVARCILFWQQQKVGSDATLAQGEVERTIEPPARRTLVNFDGVFKGMGLVPGDRIVYWVEVHDNRMPEAQLARTRRNSFFVYQEDLANLSVKQLGFGRLSLNPQRLAKARRSTSVKNPEGRRTRERVVNEFDADIVTATPPPSVRGEYSQATRDYFRALSTVSRGPESETNE